MTVPGTKVDRPRYQIDRPRYHPPSQVPLSPSQVPSEEHKSDQKTLSDIESLEEFVINTKSEEKPISGMKKRQMKTN